MFEAQTVGLPTVGAEELYLGGAQVVLGIADERGELVGWFGREYHPARRAPIHEIGAVEPPIGRPYLALGLALGDDEHVIGWFGSSFLKNVSKVVTAPVKAAVQATTAPFRMVADIAQGKNVLQTIKRTTLQPFQTGAGGLMASTKLLKPVTKALKKAPFARTPFGQTLVKPLEAGLQLATAPVKTVAAIAQGKNVIKTVKQEMFVKPLQTHIEGTKAALKVAEPVMKVAAPVIKSPITKAVAGGLAIAYPPVGVPLAAGLAAADLYLRYAEKAKPVAALALASADKILSAAKGTMPAMQQAPPEVAAKLKAAAKKSVAATYAAAKLGDPDAQRGMQVLQVARRIQSVVPAMKANVKPAVAPVPEQRYTGIHVDKRGAQSLGQWVASAAAGAEDGTIVLGDGMPMAGKFLQVA